MTDEHRREMCELLDWIVEKAKMLWANNPEHELLELAIRLTKKDDFLFGQADDDTVRMLEAFRSEEESVTEVLTNFLAAIEDALEELEEDACEDEATTSGAVVPA